MLYIGWDKATQRRSWISKNGRPESKWAAKSSPEKDVWQNSEKEKYMAWIKELWLAFTVNWFIGNEDLGVEISIPLNSGSLDRVWDVLWNLVFYCTVIEAFRTCYGTWSWRAGCIVV